MYSDRSLVVAVGPSDGNQGKESSDDEWSQEKWFREKKRAKNVVSRDL
jgi:hypothetical protein